MQKIAHLTSAHPPYDTRIFYKECRTLARAGYDVALIAPHDRSEVDDGVRIRGVPRPRGRLERLSSTAWHVYQAALAENAEIYHFHDPELVYIGLLLRLHGKRIIYDIHEDYLAAIRQREYLPVFLRRLLSSFWGVFETLATKPFKRVLAEKYYAQRFPNGVTVLNYPLLNNPFMNDPAAFHTVDNERHTRPRLLYTGNVTEDRGALLHAQLVTLVADVEVHIVGHCNPDLANRMREIAGNEGDRLYIEGEGFRVPFERIVDYYMQGNWTAGLAVFPPTPAYSRKELTKFFEYMGSGIPILCSDFPVWQSLMEETRAGLCVDPRDPKAIAKAIRFLVAHPEEAERMGENGRQAVSERYNWDFEAQKLLAVYSGLDPQ
jgi:glycosyltransferase involved in cell wall biosynthesis